MLHRRVIAHVCGRRAAPVRHAGTLRFALLLVAAIAPAVHGETYRWVDRDGQVHYSDSPPAANDQACVDALYQIELLSQKRRAFRPGPGGTRVYLEDAARPAELERLQHQRDATCSDDSATRRDQERRAADLGTTLSPDCQTSRGKLELMLDPATRTPDSEIERQREYLRTHCPGEARNDLWMADWMVAHPRRY